MNEQKIDDGDTATADRDPIPETVTEALAKWDAGESVFTMEMGGIGPGYEQAIQIVAFEIMREFKDENLDTMPHREFDEKWESGWRARAKKAVPEGMDLTGAQVYGAMNFAFCVLRRGYRAALREPAVKDRLIQASRDWPKVPNSDDQ